MRLIELAPTGNELLPWTDRRGRFHPMRAAVFGVLCLPVLWLAVQAAMGWLGPRAVNTAIHDTGYWTIWWLLASLCVTPGRVLSGRTDVALLRRMIGNAALLYALLHLVLYCADQNWRMFTVIREIVVRFYLTIGFVALCGLVVLGVTSTDRWLLHLGTAWKRLHRIVYGLTVLGVVHYLLQSKLNVSAGLEAAGVFTWLMLWRRLPVGRDRMLAVLLGLSVVAAGLTVAYEYLWYRFVTGANPVKAVLGELNTDFGLQPAAQVLLLGVVATALTGLVRVARTGFGATVWFSAMVYALGVVAVDGAAFSAGWSSEDVLPDGVNVAWLQVGGAVGLALLGAVRWWLRLGWGRFVCDGLWLGGMAAYLVWVATGDGQRAALCGGAVLLVLLGAGVRAWWGARPVPEGTG